MEPIRQTSFVNSYTELGQLLTKARIKKEITVEELSEITKIHKSLILSLENNQYDNLPNKIYVLGFLKSLSITLGFDLNYSISLYENYLNNSETLPITDPIPENNYVSPHRLKQRILLSFGLILFLIVLSSPLIFNNRIVTPITPPDPQAITKKALSKEEHSPKESIVKNFPSSQNLIIKASHGSSRIAFKVDNNPIRKFTLRKGSSITLKGHTIRLSVGRIKNLTIKNNDQIVSVKETNKNVTNLFFSEVLAKNVTSRQVSK